MRTYESPVALTGTRATASARSPAPPGSQLLGGIEDKRPRARGLLATAWIPAVTIVAIIDMIRGDAEAFANQHDLLCIAFGIGAAVAFLTIGQQMGNATYPLVRRRLVLTSLGAVGGLVLPLMMLARVTSPDHRTVLAGTLVSACFFPLVCVYAVRTRDLFELDRTLHRTLTYGVVVCLGLAGMAALMAAHALVWDSPTLGTPAPMAFACLFLLLSIPPLHEQVARRMRHWLAPQRYGRHQLARFSDALGSAQTEDSVVRVLSDLLRQTVYPTHIVLYLPDKRGHFLPLGGGDAAAPVRPLSGVVEHMRHGEPVYRYRWDDGRSPDATALWTQLKAEVLVPVCTGGTLHAILALGAKRGGTSYHVDDFAFLRAAAELVALGLTNARALSQLRQLNTTLERTVDERTAAERIANTELQSTNANLARSLGELQQAYTQLEQNHACLLRADRLATLGRLTAGIAHEVNTPLSAVQNALKVLTELGQEYSSSIDDPSVQPTDHHDIACEIITTARSAADWAEKAARFIRGTKAHGRTARDAEPERFAVGDVVGEVRTLLVHRLRIAECTFDCTEARPGISVVGDRSALAQVMINLISNALDAYEDARVTNGRIVVSISQTAETVTIEVRDWAGGIPLQILPRIFEELFTTKRAGRGTGLGLWISRTIVEKEFGGLLDVMSVPGDGSCFIATIPAAPADARPGAAPRQQAA